MKRAFLGLALCLAAIAPAAAQQTPALLLYGGQDHKTFLGCLNCADSNENSVMNGMGDYKWNSSFGIWNNFGDFKSQFSEFSACNATATDAPIIVDESGNYYGRLSLNESIDGGVCSAQATWALCLAVKEMCGR